LTLDLIKVECVARFKEQDIVGLHLYSITGVPGVLCLETSDPFFYLLVI